jgi:hypothetical protein
MCSETWNRGSNAYEHPDSKLEGFDAKDVNYNTAIRGGAKSGVSQLPEGIVYSSLPDDTPQY